MSKIQLPKIQEVLKVAFAIFPNTYWSDVFQKRLEDPNCPSADNLFNDIFQFSMKRKDEKTALVLPFCTIPKTSEHWDIVLASYVVSDPEAWKSPRNVCRHLMNYLGTNPEKDHMLRDDKIEGFDRETKMHIARIGSGQNCYNKFFSNPEVTLERIYEDLVEMGTEKQKDETEEEFKQRKQKIKKEANLQILNDPKHSEQFQKELQILEKLSRGE